MSKSDYIFLNRIIVLFAALIVAILLFGSFSDRPTCIHLVYTGKECGSCGVTRDIISFLNFDFTTSINQNSVYVFAFGVLQLIYRSYISTINKATSNKTGEIYNSIFKSLPFQLNKISRLSIKKVIIIDMMITFILSILVFLPFWL